MAANANNNALRAALNASRAEENARRAAAEAANAEQLAAAIAASTASGGAGREGNNSANANLERVLRESAELHAQRSQITASEAARLAKAEKDNEEMAIAASLESQKREAALRDKILREQRAREASEMHAAIELSKASDAGGGAAATAAANSTPLPAAAAAAVNSTPLPGDWTEHQNDASGKTYYYKAKTGESKWERPVEEVPAAAPVAAAAAANSASLPNGWTEYKNDEGTPYYYKTETGESKWNRPTRRRKRQRRSIRRRRTLRH